MPNLSEASIRVILNVAKNYKPDARPGICNSELVDLCQTALYWENRFYLLAEATGMTAEAKQLLGQK